MFKLFEIGAQFSSTYSQKLASLHASQLYFLMLRESGKFFSIIVCLIRCGVNLVADNRVAKKPGVWEIL